MNVQPIEHGVDTAAAQPQSTKAANTAAQKKQLPRVDAAQNAKISRRKSLKKQRQAQKVRWRAASG
jgi:hypothetical protein